MPNYIKPNRLKIACVMIAIVGVKLRNTSHRTNHRTTVRKPEEEEEDVPPYESPTNVGPGGPGGGDDHADSPSRGRGRRGGDPSGPPPDDLDDVVTQMALKLNYPRREADKVTVPPFPEVTHLDSWMSHCIANVLSLCADPNHEEWISGLQPAFRPDPDIDGMIEPGHIKFKSIDVKLGVAMTSMLKSAGDTASDLYLDVNRYFRSEAKLIKGRQIIAMMYESFRTRDRTDMIVSMDYLIKLQYQGDRKMSTFKQTWLEVTGRMRPEDVPSDTALRDTLQWHPCKCSPTLCTVFLVPVEFELAYGLDCPSHPRSFEGLGSPPETGILTLAGHVKLSARLQLSIPAPLCAGDDYC